MKLLEILEKTLKNEPNFITDNGELKKWVVLNKAQNFDEELIELLLSEKELREKFFKQVKDITIFNQPLFIQFLEQKNYLNDSYTQYKNKVGLTIGGKYLKQRNEVSLVWPFKDCILEGGQNREEQKREEIFFNEILAQDEITQLLEPKILTNAKRIDKEGEKPFDNFNRNEQGTITDNLIIKGNNLLALHTLKKEFVEKVKLIYIDPPYNPDSAANTFTYNNSFNHSSWLTFMKNRALIAKELLSKDGFFCTAIDHNELFYIGILLDEIFGMENRIGIIAVETNPGGRSDSKFFATSHENFIVYSKNVENAIINNLDLNEKEINNYNLQDEQSEYKLVPLRRTGSNSTPDKRPNLYFPIYYNINNNKICLEKKDGYLEILPIGSDGIKRVWRWSKNKILNDINDIVIKKSKNNYSVFVKDRIKNGKKAKTLWYGSKYDASSYGTKLLQKFNLEDNFSYPKPIYLIKDIIQILTNKNDIIIDFHAGSGTTAHAIIEQNLKDEGNRSFILVEQMDYIETVTLKRVQKVIENNGNGNFVYLELKKYNESFIEQIEKAKNTNALLKIWEEMKKRSFLNYNVDIKKQDDHIEDFKNLSLKQQKEHLCELLDKNQLYVNLSSMNDKDFSCTDEEKRITKDFYEIKE